MTRRWLLILLLQVSSLTPGLKLIWRSHHEYSCSYIVVNVWPWRHWVGHGPALASSRTAFKAADKVTLPLAIPLALQSRRTRDVLHSFSSQSSWCGPCFSRGPLASFEHQHHLFLWVFLLLDESRQELANLVKPNFLLGWPPRRFLCHDSLLWVLLPSSLLFSCVSFAALVAMSYIECLAHQNAAFLKFSNTYFYVLVTPPLMTASLQSHRFWNVVTLQC